MVIKLPVRMWEAFGSSENSFLLDADDKFVSYEAIASALNSAPTRAFEGLTEGAIAQMRSEICETLGEYPAEGSGDDQAAWLAKADAAFLSRLQVFAAPQVPQWQPLGEEGASGQVFFGHSKLDGLSIWVLEAAQDGENWYECVYSEAGHSEDLPTVTHWMPLPAAPEVRGGPDHG